MYHPDMNLAGQRVEDTALGALPLGEQDAVIKRNGEKILISGNRSEVTGWNMVASVPMHEMASGLDFARKATFFVMTGIIIVSLLFIPRMVSQVVRPILRLRNLMKQVETGDTNVRAELVEGKDEIQRLNGDFNQMTARLNELIHTVHHLEINEMHLRCGKGMPISRHCRIRSTRICSTIRWKLSKASPLSRRCRRLREW